IVDYHHIARRRLVLRVELPPLQHSRSDSLKICRGDCSIIREHPSLFFFFEPFRRKRAEPVRIVIEGQVRYRADFINTWDLRQSLFTLPNKDSARLVVWIAVFCEIDLERQRSRRNKTRVRPLQLLERAYHQACPHYEHKPERNLGNNQQRASAHGAGTNPALTATLECLDQTHSSALERRRQSAKDARDN